MLNKFNVSFIDDKMNKLKEIESINTELEMQINYLQEINIKSEQKERLNVSSDGDLDEIRQLTEKIDFQKKEYKKLQKRKDEREKESSGQFENYYKSQ